VVDEPVNTGSTMIQLLGLLRQAGIPSGQVVALLPLHPTRRNWRKESGELAATRGAVIPLQPEETHKMRLLGAEGGPAVIRGYFEHNGLTVRSISEERCLNAALDGLSEQKFHSRLKRVYEVEAVGRDGRSQTRYVLAKSVGWGWLSYHAFLAGDRLSRFVPPVLGLRDGILYTKWLPQRGPAANGSRSVSLAAEYIAARTRVLRLAEDPAPALARTGQHKGLEELAGILSRAYGSKMASVLRRPRILAGLEDMASPLPTLVDGKMRPVEWIEDGTSALKTDFEQHGQGKTELNVADPAYDLAETILDWQLTPADESKLIGRYMELSGDSSIRERLFVFKLLAGNWALDRALDNLRDPRLARRHGEFNRRYVEAFDFLTEHTARHAGSFCVRPKALRWKPPVVVADVDGVLDKQIFGYPSTTAAGILAVSLLQAHGLTLALNTARSLAQVKAYAEAFGCVGGIAEYGSVAWDRVSGQERVLISEEALAELEQVRKALRAIPGVFLNDNYQYSIRAYLHERGTTVPLPSILIRDLMAALKADRLGVHQTFTDTAVIALETDKGRGMSELLSLAGAAGAETIAIGDSEPDLAMFQAATRSFAPGHISCRRAAQLLGCRVAKGGYQTGLLEIARLIAHGDGAQCATCRAVERAFEAHDDRFLGYLKIADRSRLSLLAGALFDFQSMRAFRE
jgi:hydroxymethylpyrimidine pyrophosphatase-like HAD family hydrolase